MTNKAIENMGSIDEEAKETFDAILLKLKDFNEKYDEQIKKTIDANKSLIESFNELIRKESEAKKSSGGSSNNNSSGGDTSPSTPTPIGGPDGGPSDNPVTPKEVWGP